MKQSVTNTFDSAPEFRQEVYRLLAALYQTAPSEAMLSLLQELQINLADAENPELIGAFVTLQKQVNSVEKAALDEQFFTLFVGLSEGDVPPYASWYLHGHLFANSLLLLRQHLQSLGIVRHSDNKEPEDHITAILQVMAILIGTEGEHQQHAFFEQHLQPWYGMFCERLIKHQQSPFYQRVGELTFTFLQQEQRHLAGWSIPVTAN
ncbi:molecular chaperone [Thalassotalea maritima]|uniref:TorD/DmsD family molecular chaperone n=1 Tax=Thalassotalea maritima TaxID=3242416 RepID=UPI003526E4AB